MLQKGGLSIASVSKEDSKGNLSTLNILEQSCVIGVFVEREIGLGFLTGMARDAVLLEECDAFQTAKRSHLQ